MLSECCRSTWAENAHRNAIYKTHTLTHTHTHSISRTQTLAGNAVRVLPKLDTAVLGGGGAYVEY